MDTHRHRAQAGVSLIEVLVSLVILSLGVLAVVALQLIAKRNNADAGQRTVAAQLAYSIVERMRANSTADALENYLTGSAPLGRGTLGDAEPETNCRGTVDANGNVTAKEKCSEELLVAYDLWAWEQALDGAAEQAEGSKTGGLLFPTGCIEGPPGGGPDGIYTITIAWRGTVTLPDNPDIACGKGATDGTNRLYGTADEYRRTLRLPVYITARRRAGA